MFLLVLKFMLRSRIYLNDSLFGIFGLACPCQMRVFYRWSWSVRADLDSLLSPFKFLFGFVNQRFSLNYVADRSRVVSLTPKHSNCVIL